MIHTGMHKQAHLTRFQAVTPVESPEQEEFLPSLGLNHSMATHHVGLRLMSYYCALPLKLLLVPSCPRVRSCLLFSFHLLLCRLLIDSEALHEP